MQPSFNFSPSLPPSLPVLLSPIPKGAQYDPMKYNNLAAIAINHLAKKMPLQWSAVTVTAVTVTVGYSDSFANPRFITNKTPLLTVTKNRLQ